jgi:hypothetical protein
MPLISAAVCTDICLKDGDGYTFIPAFSAAFANSGMSKSALIMAIDSCPSILPALWDRMRFSSAGISPSSKQTMLHL